MSGEYGRRLGKFTLGFYFIDDESKRNVLHKLFSYMIPVRAESRWDLNAIEYVALSPLFEEIAPREMTPEYQITMTLDGNGIQAKRVDKDPKKPERFMILGEPNGG